MDYVKSEDIRGTYTFGPILGEGNFAKVYKAQHNDDPDMVVAIKSIAKTPDVDKFLQNECEILFRLEHENIIKIYEVYDSATEFHIVMEYMEGKDLHDRFIDKGIRDEPTICKIITTLTYALDYCHKNEVVHRDLKPQNILLSTNDESAVYKIADFGLARVVGDEMMTTACGTPTYLSPEIVNGQPYDKKADFWSLGVLLYNLLCGSAPFTSPQPDQLFEKIKSANISFAGPEWAGVSEMAKDLVLHMLKKNPVERYDAEKVLNHPWIKCGGVVEMDIEK